MRLRTTCGSEFRRKTQGQATWSEGFSPSLPKPRALCSKQSQLLQSFVIDTRSLIDQPDHRHSLPFISTDTHFQRIDRPRQYVP